MKTFVQYLESKFVDKDEENILRMGLKPSNMRIIRRKPREYSEEEILKSEYLYLKIPEVNNPEWNPKIIAQAEKLRPYNGQIVSRYPYNHSSKQGVWIDLFTGRHEEGNAYRIPFEWLKPVNSKKGKSHGEWLDKTFFDRSNYVTPEERKGNWKYNQKINLSSKQEEFLYDYLGYLDKSIGPNRQGLKGIADKIREEEEAGHGYTVSNLMVLADALLDVGKDKESNYIRGIVDEYMKI